MIELLRFKNGDLFIRIPEKLVAELNWAESTPVLFTIAQSKLIIEAVAQPVYDLEKLLEGITPENLHSAVDTGPAMGNEIW